MDKLQIDGAVEFDNRFNHYLEANMVLINGGQLIVGFENNPILTNVTLNLTGDLNTSVARRRRALADTNFTQGFSLIQGKGIGV